VAAAERIRPSRSAAGVLLDWVADASGAPVLRDQGPIGRPGTARQIQAVTLYMAIDGAAVSSRPVAADELQIWLAAEAPWLAAGSRPHNGPCMSISCCQDG
jgi:hypothetical protein